MMNELLHGVRFTVVTMLLAQTDQFADGTAWDQSRLNSEAWYREPRRTTSSPARLSQITFSATPETTR